MFKFDHAGFSDNQGVAMRGLQADRPFVGDPPHHQLVPCGFVRRAANGLNRIF